MSIGNSFGDNFLTNVLDNQVEMVIVFKIDGEIVYVNKSLCDVFGVTRGVLIGKKLEEILTAEQLEERFVEMRKINVDNPFVEGVREIMHQDGAVLFQDWRTTGLFDDEGRLVMYQSVGKDVTKREREERLIRTTKENLSLALQYAKMGEFHTYTKLDEFYFSNDLLKLFGVEEDDFKGNFSSYLQFIPVENRAEVRKKIFEYIANPIADVLEYEHEIIRQNDGQLRWLLVRSKLHFDEIKKSKKFSGIAIDITEKKISELQIRKQQENLSFALNSAKIGEFEWFIKEDRAVWSTELYSLFGITKDQYDNTFEGFLSMIPENGRDKAKNAVIDFMLSKSKELLVFENEINKPDGTVIWVQNRCRMNFDSQGEPYSFSGVIIDFTTKKKEELSLLQHERQVSLALSYGKVSEFKWFVKNDVLYWPSSMYALYGLKETEFEPSFKNYLTLLPKETVSWFKDLVFSFIAEADTTKIYEIKHRVILRDGTERWFLLRSGLELDESGEVFSFPGVTIDITEVISAEEKLRKSEERLKLATDVTKLGSFEWKLGMNDFSWGKNMHEIFELAIDSKVNRVDYFEKVLHPEDRTRIQDFYQQSILPNNSDDLFESEHRVLLPSGKVKYLKHHAMYFRDDEGVVEKIIGTYLDVTKQKQVEEQLKEALSELNKLKSQLEQENLYLQEEISFAFNFENLVYGSAEFSDVLTEVERVAPTDATVLITGETGTGKELIARAVHNTSLRKEKPLIKVNCAAIPRELIESELFGHEKGSFTGAIKDKMGKFELADGGTIFLDEIGELPMDLQPKLLRALQEGEIERVGGTGVKVLDVRVIAATNRVLSDEVEKGRFRNDLYFRLNVFPIKIPPLRDRVEDVPVLVDYFIKKYGLRYKKSIQYIPDLTLKNMCAYSWPGNVRELANSIERAVIRSSSEVLELSEFSGKTSDKKKSIDYLGVKTLDDVQREYVLKILKKHSWVIAGKSGAAEALGLKPSTLRDKMKKLQISRPNR